MFSHDRDPAEKSTIEVARPRGDIHWIPISPLENFRTVSGTPVLEAPACRAAFASAEDRLADGQFAVESA